MQSNKEHYKSQLLARRDKRSTLGANLELIVDMTGLDPWTAGKRELRAALDKAMRPEVPDGDHWRIAALHKLLSARLTADNQSDKLEVDRLQELIDSLCVN